MFWAAYSDVVIMYQLWRCEPQTNLGSFRNSSVNTRYWLPRCKQVHLMRMNVLKMVRNVQVCARHVTPCHWVSGFRRFDGTCCHHQESRGPRRLFDRQSQGTMIVRNVGTTHPAYLFAIKALNFLTGCTTVLLLRSTVFQGVVMWLVGWLVGWFVRSFVEILVRNDWYSSFWSHVLWFSVSER
jgi:hypothetical protein